MQKERKIVKQNEINAPKTEDLMYEIGILLEAMLYFAGVKKGALQKAVDIYIENIDEILQNSDADGVDEVLEVVEYMKKNHKELFA